MPIQALSKERKSECGRLNGRSRHNGLSASCELLQEDKEESKVNSSNSLFTLEQQKAIQEAQKLLDEIMQTRPYCEYAKARQLGLVDSKLELLDKLQNEGLITITQKCDCVRV